MKLNKQLLLTVALFCGSFVAQNVWAQTGEHITYKIKQGDNLSALARKYGTTVGAIMRLNGMNTKSILRIGEDVKIPVKGKSEAAAKTPATPVEKPAKQALVVAPATDNTNALTHTVAKGESLYKISHQYKITLEQLKQWNHLTNNNIRLGQVLVVGQSVAVAVKENNTIETVNTPSSPATKITPSVTNSPAPALVVNEKPATVSQPTPTPVNTLSAEQEGYFSSSFNKQKSTNTIAGDAAAFKTSSGWADKKYYVLMNNVDAGTIVKVTSNNKSIYAKVLGPLPDVKDDAGLLLRISNSAAAALGVDELRFNISVSF